MKILKNDSNYAEIAFSLEELYNIQQCLNEICYGISIYKFDSRIGKSRQEMINLMNALTEIIQMADEENKNY